MQHLRVAAMKEITVKELIEMLQAHPQDMAVVLSKFSEQVLLTDDYVFVVDLCEPRPDGWVQSRRPDMPTRKYLMFAA